VLVVLMLAGALVRHFFVARHKAKVLGQQPPYLAAGAGTALVVALIAWLAPQPGPVATAPAAPVTLAQVQAVVEQRCVLCHNAQLHNKDVDLHTGPLIEQRAQQIYQQAVVARTMPFNNATGITEEERGLLRRWYLERAAQK
jgi:uncharacterized membrane protein